MKHFIKFALNFTLKFLPIMGFKNYTVFLVGLVFVIWGCRPEVKIDAAKPDTDIASNDHLIMSVLWQQKAAESRALYYQAYNIAKLRLDNYLQSNQKSLKNAVIVDIDETILDNSPYEATVVKTNKGYPSGWQEWTDLSQARATNGSVEFLQYAVSQKVDIFYVSNRDVKSKASTAKNLDKLGFPQIEDDHLFFKSGHDIKDSIRTKLAQEYHIALLIGDNLNDFAKIFEKKTIQERFNVTDSLREEFGNRFIILPNAMYGEWEGSIYKYDYNLSHEEKAVLRKTHLDGYPDIIDPKPQ